MCVSTRPAPGGTLTKDKTILDTAFITVIYKLDAIIVKMMPGWIKRETKNDSESLCEIPYIAQTIP